MWRGLVLFLVFGKLLFSSCAFAESDLDKGVRAAEQGRHLEAAEHFARGANTGDLDANHRLARLYWEGKGVAQDRKYAQWLFGLGAEARHMDSMRAFGTICLHGLTGKAYPACGVAMLTLGAEMADDLAILVLARSYRDGKGVDADRIEAMKWYLLAMRVKRANGEDPAQYERELRAMNPAPTKAEMTAAVDKAVKWVKDYEEAEKYDPKH
jgi:TPR repeat protein